MGQKARSGGWPHKAPIGYRNIRQDGLRRSMAQIVRDPVQAPLVREAFQVFSCGELSIRQLRDLMDRGPRDQADRVPRALRVHSFGHQFELDEFGSPGGIRTRDLSLERAAS